jgi:oxygen-independent coproporphyrinogen-3 oxidase
MYAAATADAGLYIHIPFCEKKCAYCDFYSIADLTRMDAFVDGVIREMALLKNLPQVFDTIYLGGGTPSVLSAQNIEKLLFQSSNWFDIQEGAEITIEINPGTVDHNKLGDFRQAGINRINIGVQSFSTAALELLGRIHTAEQAVYAISLARQAGFDNLGLDLIYGLPGQSPESWQKELEQAIGVSPEHLSCYTLTYEKGTPLGKMKAQGRVEPLDDDAVADLFKIMQSVLVQHGYEHYEIANFARDTADNDISYRSRHNQKYWTSAPYIGLGPSAHSFVEPERRWNVADLHTYLSKLKEGALPVDTSEILTPEQRLTETLYLELRTMEGIDILRLEQTFGLNFHKRYENTLDDLVQEGLIKRTRTRCNLTRKGMRFLDGIVERLISQKTENGGQRTEARGRK